MGDIILTITANSTNGRTVADYSTSSTTYNNVLVGDNITIDWGDGTPLETYDGNLNHTFPGDGTFTVTISGATGIRQYFLREWKPLTGITLPRTISSLEGSFVLTGTNITEIEVPVGITSLPIYFCYNCQKLLKATLPRTLITLGSYCFYWCKALKEVNIPFNVAIINTGFLQSDNAIEKIYFENSVCPSVGSNFLKDTNSSYKIYVPNIANYVNATNTPSDTSKYEQYSVAYSIAFAYNLLKEILVEEYGETVTDYDFSRKTGDGLMSLIEKVRGL